MAKKDKGSKGGKGLVVDFSDVQEGSGGKFNKRVKAGTYLGEVVAHKTGTSQNGNTMITLDFEVDGCGKYRERFPLTENALWKLFNFLKAAGKNPKKAKAKLNPAAWMGLKVGLDLGDDEYENKSGKMVKQSVIEGFVSPDEVGKSGKKGKKSKKGKKNDNDTVDSVDLDDEL